MSLGDWITCGNAHLQVIHANANDDNENNNSIVLFGTIEEETYLFAADIEAKEEEVVMEFLEHVDVLKVPHHGSDTSSTLDFVKALSPSVAIVSVGKNSYGHPSSIILSRYENTNSTMYLTKSDGTISIWHFPLFKLRWIRCFLW